MFVFHIQPIQNNTKVYQYSLFNIDNPHRVNTLFLINTHFFNDSICLLNDSHFHLIDHTTMNYVCRFRTFYVSRILLSHYNVNNPTDDITII